MRKVFVTGRILFALLLIGPLAATAWAAPSTAPTIKVALLSNKSGSYRAEWRQRGFYQFLKKRGMKGRLIDQSQFMGDKWTAERIYQALKPFHVLIFSKGHYLSTQNPDTGISAYAKALQRYVKEGGGLLVIAQLQHYWGDKEWIAFSKLFAGFDMEMLGEGISDPEHTFVDESFAPLRGKSASRYFYTTHIAASEVTQGVKRIYLPQYRNMFGTPAVVYGKPWTVVIKGMDSAQSYKPRDPHGDEPTARGMTLGDVGYYQTTPPIAAIRQFGKGRVVAYSDDAMDITLNYGNPSWPRISESRGDPSKGQGSDSYRFIANSLKWLAQPALKNPDLGGYVEKPLPSVAYPKSLNWSRFHFSKPQDQQAAGLIGIHTSLSDGTGTVALYVSAAKRAGLKFIVFCEDLEHLTREDFAKLKQQCAQATSKDFVACPGLEFTDGAGLRWAMWSPRLTYPDQKLLSADGKRIEAWGQYSLQASGPPTALLSYDKLENIGDPANLWWFYDLPLAVYDGTTKVADHLDQWRFAMADLRRLSPIIYTRLKSPEKLAAAARLGRTVVLRSNDAHDALAWLGSARSRHVDDVYVTQGPRIRLWQGLNAGMPEPAVTRGRQRIRLKFDVASDAGIKAVLIHDQNRGVLRRFLGHGQREFSKEFELVQDKQRKLTLEVVDEDGRRAISPYIFIYCYKAGLYRCSDNLNMLGSAGILTHPDRSQWVGFKTFENLSTKSIIGLDTGTGVMTQPDQRQPWEGAFAQGRQNPLDHQSLYQTPLRIPYASADVSLLEAKVTQRVRRGASKGSFLPVVGEVPYMEIDHRAWLLQSRMDYYMTWNHRRPFEGSRRYKGGVIIHEETIRFKKDVTLKGSLPVVAEYLFYHPYPPGQGEWNHVLLDDAQKGPVSTKIEADESYRAGGTLAPGGYLAAGPTQAGYQAFIVSDSAPFGYRIGDRKGWAGRVELGFGRDGQQFKAGDTVTLRYLDVTLPDWEEEQNAKTLTHLSKVFRMNGLKPGYGVKVEVGEPKSSQIFMDVAARDHEAVFDIESTQSICDMPIRVYGIQDNGCAAVYVLNERSEGGRFRYVPVYKGRAVFQQALEMGPRLWVGNVFVADRPELKLTLVVDGQIPGNPPFLMVHNPTDQAISTTLTSPAHTPLFGGRRYKVDVPAGDSVKVILQTHKQP